MRKGITYIYSWFFCVFVVLTGLASCRAQGSTQAQAKAVAPDEGMASKVRISKFVYGKDSCSVDIWLTKDSLSYYNCHSRAHKKLTGAKDLAQAREFLKLTEKDCTELQDTRYSWDCKSKEYTFVIELYFKDGVKRFILPGVMDCSMLKEMNKQEKTINKIISLYGKLGKA